MIDREWREMTDVETQSLNENIAKYAATGGAAFPRRHFEPWSTEPNYRDGGEFCYVVRVCNQDSASVPGLSSKLTSDDEPFLFPNTGYVADPNYCTEVKRGLYGFKDGVGNWSIPYLLLGYTKVFKLLVCKESELEWGVGGREVFFPRAWVKYSSDNFHEFYFHLIESGCAKLQEIACELYSSVRYIEDMLNTPMFADKPVETAGYRMFDRRLLEDVLAGRVAGGVPESLAQIVETRVADGVPNPYSLAEILNP